MSDSVLLSFQQQFHESRAARISGLVGAAGSYLVAQALLQQAPAVTWIIVPTGKDMERWTQELRFFLGETLPVYEFPAMDTLPYFQISPHRDVQAQRVKSLHALNQQTGPLVLVSPAAAAAGPVLAPQRLQDKQQSLKPKQSCDRDILVSLLLDWGYQQAPLVEDRGTYAVRGSLVDFWGPLDDWPWRVELFGDEIESIRRFDPAKQTSLEPVLDGCLIPVRELIWDDASREQLAQKIRARCDEQGLGASEKRDTIDKIRQGHLFGGIEQFALWLNDTPTGLNDYMPDDCRVLCVEPQKITEHLEDLHEEMQTSRQQSESIERILEVDELLDTRLIDESLKPRPTLLLSEDSSDDDHLAMEMVSNEDIRWNLKQRNDMPFRELAQKIKTWSEDHQVVFVSSSRAQQKRLLDLFAPYDLPLRASAATVFSATVLEPGVIPVLIGQVGRGFRWSSQHLIVISDEEIFGPKAHKQSKSRERQGGFMSFGELKSGDPLVHEEHGIGRYLGVERMTIDGIDNDFLVLAYANQDKLFLPVYRMNQIQPYTGNGKEPRLDRMGGASWHKVRAKAQKAIRHMAGELLNLYAQRAAGQGHAFSAGNELFETFEASFPHEETGDQARTIAEVIKDMELNEPMDRLVLGDVGYGKTEVAMRAAFKAVLDNKQVAILVPTTVLAFQHAHNFKQRFADYPVKVGLISRFQTRQEAKQVMAELASGAIDIIIGTHRLLQSDVSFKDLGLLVIDEEHRFGVTQKEKIKQFKKSVDVLALSATPIPRTLNMAMSGLRGISVIETPPTDRLSIRTYVTPDSDVTIQEAVQREVRRGGQVFFVHNRVQDIERTADRLRRILPDIRLLVGHGQMKEHQLEDVMIRFSNHEADLLLCTTIIESGIDIPTANTILIERADQLGLAQIYQLRGRVGRGSQRAYAYMLVPPRKELTVDAKKRLDVLRRFSELGSGFKMACHDLEIRGAGNVLGDKQSGHLEAIGYELYVELLEQAIKELKGEVIVESIEPELHLRVTATIPEDYIRDPALRLELYRRLAALEDEERGYELEEEFIDRFGPLPLETEQLIQLMMIKAMAKKLRIRALHYSPGKFAYIFDPQTPLAPEAIMKRISKEPKKYRLTPDMKLIVKETIASENERLTQARYFLKSLYEHANFT